MCLCNMDAPGRNKVKNWQIIYLSPTEGNKVDVQLEAQGPCPGHRSSIAILYCFSFKYMKREKGRDQTQYTNLCGLNTLPH